MSFYERFVTLCNQKGVKPSRAASDCGINRSNVTNWKNKGYTPRGDVLQHLADYFGVSADYLLGAENKETPVLNKKDERDIAKTIEQIMDQLADSEDLMFDGNPMSPEARASMLSAVRVGLEMAKIKNKERFTPKGNKKG